jgi:hypothetical protein
MAETTMQQQPRTADGRRTRPATNSAATQTAPATRISPAAVETTVSGTYAWTQPGATPFARAELRLDVDGLFPLLAASGRESAGMSRNVSWVARPLQVEDGPTGPVWTGPVSYTNPPGTFLFQYTDVRIERNGQLLRLTLQGAGPDLVRDYKFSSPAFNPVEFEFDAVEGITPVTSINTFDHPDRPASLPDEELTIETVYRRAGFDVRMSGGDSIVPLSLAGADEKWSNAEMHDAMQVHWSKFANKAQWSFWTLFAALHEEGTSLGGIMFDDIGPQQRQGTSLFLKSFIATAPASDPAPEAWVRRMAFWTACHEMGHTFNLAHSWQKDLGTPWMPMASGYDLLTFMNYPFLYRTGSFSDANTVAFFRNFDFRFTDEELLFLRHAPEAFVEQGNAEWFDHHGFEQAEVSPVPALGLTCRVNRAPATFELLEPVVVELKLTNLTDEPMMVPDKLLRSTELLTVIVKRNNTPARKWQPYAHCCWRSKNAVLERGNSMYESLFLSAGKGDWAISEPGIYQIRVCLRVGGEDVVSNPLTIRVLPPRSYDEQSLAQDFFTDDVGRTLAFDGTRYLERANTTLREIVERFPQSRAAVHANIALAMPLAKPHKLLDLPTESRNGAVRGPQARINVKPAEAEAIETFAAALGLRPDGAQKAAEALGHIDYRYYAEKHCDVLEERGDKREAQEARQLLYETLVERRVLGKVTDEVRAKLDGGEEDERRGRSPRRR